MRKGESAVNLRLSTHQEELRLRPHGSVVLSGAIGLNAHCPAQELAPDNLKGNIVHGTQETIVPEITR